MFYNETVFWWSTFFWVKTKKLCCVYSCLKFHHTSTPSFPRFLTIALGSSFSQYWLRVVFSYSQSDMSSNILSFSVEMYAFIQISIACLAIFLNWSYMNIANVPKCKCKCKCSTEHKECIILDSKPLQNHVITNIHYNMPCGWKRSSQVLL